MGNQQSAYTPFTHPTGIQHGVISQSFRYGSATAITALPVQGYNVQQDQDCCGPNVPASCQTSDCCGPSYAPGIANAGFYGQNNNQCCNWNNQIVNPVLPSQGYITGGFTEPQSSLDQWCCGPTSLTVPAVQPYATQVAIVPNTVQPLLVPVSVHPDLPVGLETPQTIMRTSFVASQLPNLDHIHNSVIQTEVYEPLSSTVYVNPFANLPTRILTVIQKLGSVNPLRGSIMNRLQTPQYVPEKQAHYQGQWINGYMEGFGRLYFDSGAYFEGEFVNGLAQTRHGLFIYPDGSYYIGGVDKNVANGQGEFNYRNGRLIYKGQFLNDQPDGKGTELYSDGSRYEGEFRFGKKEGRGEFVWRDGTVYTGQFQNGFMQGEGVHSLSNGQTYKGEFRKNKRHGRGVHITALGTYNGGYKRDKKEGEGTFSWADGKVFKGHFHNGKPDGQGSLAMLDGTTVYGIWINGVLDQNSLTSSNPFRGSQLNNPRASIVSVGSVGSLQNAQFDSQIARTSQITPGPPVINLKAGMLAGGFVGTASPFVNQRGSIVSVIGPGGDFRGSSIPRSSSLQSGSYGLFPSYLNTTPTIRGSGINILPSTPRIIPSTAGRRGTGFPPMPPSVPTFGSGVIPRGSSVGLNLPVTAPVSPIFRGSQVMVNNPNVVPVVPPVPRIVPDSIVSVNTPLGARGVGPVGIGGIVPPPTIPAIQTQLPPPRLPQPFRASLLAGGMPSARYSSVSPNPRSIVGINRPITPGLISPVPDSPGVILR